MDSSVRTLDSGNSETNEIQLSKLHYAFPVGDFKITAGPLMKQNDVISATTTIYSSAFRLAEMPWAAEEDEGAGVGIEYVADNGWNGSFNLIAENASDATSGAFTEEGTDKWTASIGYDADNYGGGIVYTDEDSVDTSFGVGAYFRPEGLPTISVTYDQLSDEDATDSSDLMVGFDYPVGPGVASAAIQTRDTSGTTTTNYEVYYNYPINDSVAVQGGVFFEEVAATTDQDTQGLIVETFFKF